MIAAYYRERDAAREYHGRELLELLQNADDAGAEINKRNKVLIELSGDGLLVANSGHPFTEGGVRSLMIQNLSPKKLSRTRFIGYKGLGFRSVLGWASEIAIVSNNLRIGFSRAAAHFVGTWLSEKDLALAERVAPVLAKFESFPIPTLACPFWISELPSTSAEYGRMLGRAEALEAEGFDTVIAFTFGNQLKTRPAVEAQIAELGKQILLFSNFLDDAEIRSPHRNVVWKADRDANEILIEDSSEQQPSLWKIFTESNEVPPQYIDPGEAKNAVYEVKIAITENADEIDATNSSLFVYFPTAIAFPYPVVAHATFELTSNRQNLVNSGLNNFVADRLADLLALAAASSADSTRPWKSMSIVCLQGALDPILRELGSKHSFRESVRDFCASRCLIPSRGERGPVFRAASGGMNTIAGDFDELLSGRSFEHLCLHTENKHLVRQLKYMGVSEITPEEIRNSFESISDTLGMKKRAKIIFGLVDNKLVEAGKGPALLLDQHGKVIPAGVPVFLPPEGKAFTVPEWVPLRFLNAELTSLLTAQFGQLGSRELARLLKDFGIQEYKLEPIISAILTVIDEKIGKERQAELTFRQRAIAAIWDVFSIVHPEASVHLDKQVVLPTRIGGFAPAEKLYFGRDYTAGKLAEALLGNVDQGLFVTSPGGLGLNNKPGEIEPFLKWLGVESFPRESITYQSSRSDFGHAVLSALDYPADFGRGEYYMRNQEDVLANSSSISRVSSFEHFERIVNSSDHHAIIAWLALDRRPALINERDSTASLSITPYRCREPRRLTHQEILGYPLWLLKNTAWLPTLAGKRKPVQCSNAYGLSKDISGIIGVPEINEDHPLLRDLHVGRNSIRSALAQLGVSNDLNELSWDTYYDVLLRLPELDHAGVTARSLYRAFVAREGVPDASPAQKRFFASGKMFGWYGNQAGYFPVGDLFYLDNFTLPENIARLFPILDMDKRRGSVRVKTLFNVEPLSSDDVKTRIKIASYETHPWAEPLSRDLERLKQFIYALRVDPDSDRSETTALRRLQIRLCRSVQVEIKLAEGIQVVSLQPGDSVMDGDTVFLVGEPRDYGISYIADVMVADAVGEIVANALKVESLKSDIARLATCPPEHRITLLDRMTGGTGARSFDAAKQALKTVDEVNRPALTTAVPPAPNPDPVPNATPPARMPDILPPKDVGPVTVAGADIPNTEPRPSAPRAVIVGKNPAPPARRRMLDPDRAENLAFQFEIAQGRYPLKVGHLRGTGGFGCDMVTFLSAQARSDFKRTSDPSLVLRFIEVKGKVSQRGSVTLRGNELESARQHQSRYFIYRVYEDADHQGQFELVGLGDPIGAGRAVTVLYEVNPFYSSVKESWSVKEKE